MSGALAVRSGILAGFNSSPVYLGNGQVDSIGVGSRTATLRLSNDGKIYGGDNGTFSAIWNWLNVGTAGSYEVLCTVVSGLVTGTTGSWLNLGTTRDWSITDTTNNAVENAADVTLQIRDASTLAVLASGAWTIFADRTG